MPERRRRANESVRAEVNRRIAEVGRRMDPSGQASFAFLCECNRAGCHEFARLSLNEYRALGIARRRVVVPAHYEPSVGRVAAKGSTVYAVAPPA
jgi:hypothetical protein